MGLHVNFSSCIHLYCDTIYSGRRRVQIFQKDTHTLQTMQRRVEGCPVNRNSWTVPLPRPARTPLLPRVTPVWFPPCSLSRDSQGQIDAAGCSAVLWRPVFWKITGFPCRLQGRRELRLYDVTCQTTVTCIVTAIRHACLDNCQLIVN